MRDKRVTVWMPEGMVGRLGAMAEDWETSVSAVVRRAVRLMLEGTSPALDPDDWSVESKRTYAGFTPTVYVDVMRHRSRTQRAHRITQNSDSLWVLPDTATTGLRRSRTISQALANSDGVFPMSDVDGALRAIGVDPVWLTGG